MQSVLVKVACLVQEAPGQELGRDAARAGHPGGQVRRERVRRGRGVRDPHPRLSSLQTPAAARSLGGRHALRGRLRSRPFVEFTMRVEEEESNGTFVSWGTSQKCGD